ncbi:hypothetical protein BaRGS_00020735 [Batillaria attramentaria]|uniref:Uncharacterized protein n=1 Tax=Batillaria attramentaria TaxID=370345 RepID=A0ABD0KMB1_9CAEN
MALHRLDKVVCVLMLLAWNIREFGGEAAGTTDLDMQLSMIQEQAKTIQQLQARLQLLENSNREAVAVRDQITRHLFVISIEIESQCLRSCLPCTLLATIVSFFG